MKSLLYNPEDNCFLCVHADIKENEVAKLLKRIGLKLIADKLSLFPVVFCTLSGNKYVANPMKRPGWCKRGR